MNHAATSQTLVLKTDLFPDRETMERAIETMDQSAISTLEIEPDHMDQSAWDNVLKAIMSANKIIVL